MNTAHKNVSFQDTIDICGRVISQCELGQYCLPPAFLMILWQKVPQQRTVLFLQLSCCLSHSHYYLTACLKRWFSDICMAVHSYFGLQVSEVNFQAICEEKCFSCKQYTISTSTCGVVWSSYGHRRCGSCIVNLLSLVWRELWGVVLEIHRLT